MARKLRNSRPKAIFGDWAIAGALIAQTANDSIRTAIEVNQAKETANNIKYSAQKQAESQRSATQAQVSAMKESDKLNKELANTQIETAKANNEKLVRLQQTANDNMMLMMGKRNQEERMANSKIAAKYGTNIRRKLRNTKSNHSSSTGDLKFKITDGAKNIDSAFIPVEIKPDGTIIAITNPNLPSHYQKNESGRKGVGLAVAPKGKNIPHKSNLEIEGGEAIEISPDGYLESVLSRRTLPGSNDNPTLDYLTTGDYYGAEQRAEVIKAANNIPDAGEIPLRRTMKSMGGLIGYTQQPSPVTNSNQAIAAAIYNSASYNPIETGMNVTENQFNSTELSGKNKIAKYGKSLKRCKAAGGWTNRTQNVLSGLQIGSNILGSIGSTIGNLVGAGYLNDAMTEANRIYQGANESSKNAWIDAYNSLTGISADSVGLNKMKAATMMAAIQDVNAKNLAEREALARTGRAAKQSLRRNIISSNKLRNRYIEIDDNINQKLGELAQREQAISAERNAENIKALNTAMQFNAESENKLNQLRSSLGLEVAKYNADINKEKALGIGEAKSNYYMNSANYGNQTRLGIAQNNANALNNIMSSWSNTIGASNNIMQNAYNNRISLATAAAKLSPSQQETLYKLAGYRKKKSSMI